MVGQADLVDLGSRVGAWRRLENGTLDLVLVGVPLVVTGPLLPTGLEEGGPETAGISPTRGDDQRRRRQPRVALVGWRHGPNRDEKRAPGGSMDLPLADAGADRVGRRERE